MAERARHDDEMRYRTWWPRPPMALPTALLVLLAQACSGGAGAEADAGTAARGDTGAPAGGDAGDDSAGDANDDVARDGALASRCTVASTTITCAHDVLSLSDSLGTRTVAYATPLGAPPSSGWPAVVYFQGSLVAGHDAFTGSKSDPFGIYNLALTVKALLDRGYAVVAPDASGNGSTYWETNMPPYAVSWSGCPDDVLMQNLFAAARVGKFGPIDTTHLYAMGISSGGFMTSRMAVSYTGRFRALADSAGSYATCSATCSVPTPLPNDHPPTLFLHGDADNVVPMSSVQPYVDALRAEGHEVKVITDADAGHEWLVEGPMAIPAWFDMHR